MRKITYAAAILTAIAMLCSCGNSVADEPAASGGTPDNTVSRSETSAIAESLPVSTAATVATEAPVTTDADETAASQTDGQDGQDDENVSIEELGLRAPELLNLLNSNKVHAKLIEAVSYDNETTSSVQREYYVDGDNAVYINDSQKIIMSGDTVTVVDLDALTYYSYARSPGEGTANFGYGLDNYSFYSTDTSDDGTVTEVYTVSAHGGSLVSTWTFFPGGNITVSDVSPEFGSYYWYSFEIIESDTSEMDMSIPDGLTEVEPDDYF